MTAVVLVASCRTNEAAQNHYVPSSTDQSAWLRDPRMRLAVIHGGINSVYEAIAAGLPIACVPHESDQWSNCKAVQKQKRGWAMMKTASGEEARAVFDMLLKGDYSDPDAERDFVAAGGPFGVVAVLML